MTCIEIDGIFECDDLTDVWKMIFNPIEGRIYTGLETPTMKELKEIELGNIIMVSRNINKLFVEIINNEPCNFKLCGQIVLGDLEDQPFNKGDIICFYYKNVYSISEDLRCI